MIILRSIGGLGNQLFQMAYAIKLSKKYDEEIYVDLSSYEKYKVRSFSFDNIEATKYIKNLNWDLIPKKDRYKYVLSRNIYRYIQRAIKLIKKNDEIGITMFYLLGKFNLLYNFDSYFYKESKLVHKEKNKWVYGYFQSEKYFEEVKDTIFETFRVKRTPSKREEEVLKNINKTQSIAVSMRVGSDYTNSKLLNICTEEYYLKSIEVMKEKFPKAQLFIFSDDVNLVKEKFNLPSNVEYVEGFNDYENLRLMYNCDHFIISNSSFSWWGSYLSYNKEKTIIAPYKWYNHSKKTPDIYNDNISKIYF
ncbi:alpha-1,2-fucosyltransferase [Exiguobacterium sp. 9-2]|uniref:alpha-1,2-fucosyltransferase n=1 Tax=Exiguobacterium sp. 9-2 TaxID=3112419 RepID=UPI002E2F8095|nr:alpha-1,2-fucosyltransferase [Exiguobacterium sp. 9-2]